MAASGKEGRIGEGTPGRGWAPRGIRRDDGTSPPSVPRVSEPVTGPKCNNLPFRPVTAGAADEFPASGAIPFERPAPPENMYLRRFVRPHTLRQRLTTP